MQATQNPLVVATWREFHKNIVLLKINDQNFTWYGTGTIVQEGIIITCAHNFVGRFKSEDNIQYKYRAKNIEIYYRQKEDDNLRQIISKNYYVNFDYLKNKQNDFAVLHYQHTDNIKIEKLQLNWFYSYWRLIRLFKQQNLSIYLNGYIVDKRLKIQQNVLYDGAQTQQFIVLRDNLQGIRYQCKTYPGISGSPIILVNKQNGKNTYYMIGIHTRGELDNQLNYGIELNVRLLDNYNKWIGQNKSQDQLEQNFDKQLSVLNLQDQDLDYQFEILMNQFGTRNQIQFTHLKHLNLRKNQLKEDSLSYFLNHFPSLLSLILSQNYIAQGIGHLKNLKQLSLLHLSHINMNSLDQLVHIFNHLHHIRDLDLSNNPIGYIFEYKDDCSMFSKLGQLRYLSLAKTGIKNFSSLQNLNLPQLRSLDLRTQELEDRIIKQIQNYLKKEKKTLPKLTEICFNRNITQAHISNLNINEQKQYYSLIRQSNLVSYTNQQKTLLNNTNIYDNIIGEIPKDQPIQNFSMINYINLQLKSNFVAVNFPQQFPFSSIGLINQIKRISMKQLSYQFSVGTLISDNLMLTSVIDIRRQGYFFPGMCETIFDIFILMNIKQTIGDQLHQSNYCLVSVNTAKNIAIPYLNIYNPNNNIQQYTNVLQVCYKVKKTPGKPMKDQYMRVLNLIYNKKDKVLQQKNPSLDFQKLINKELYRIQGSPLLIEQNGQYKLLGITTVHNYLPKYIHCSQFTNGVKPYTNSICHLSNLNLWHKKICKLDLKYFIQRMNFIKLIRLDLGWNYINDSSVIPLFKCKQKFSNLQWLNLNTNQITKVGVEQFRSQNFPLLRQLLIANNFIQDLGFMFLYIQLQTSKIKKLDIRNNNLTVYIIKDFLQQVRGQRKKPKIQQPIYQKKKSFTNLQLIILENQFFDKDYQIRQIFGQIETQQQIIRNQSRMYIYINSKQQKLYLPLENKK